VQHLVNKSVFILREVRAKYKNPALLWAGGKDSTLMIYLAKMAFFDDVPFPCLLLDTTYQFRETYHFLNMVANMWNLDFRRVRNNEALAKKTDPQTNRFECCTNLKTINLEKTIEKNGYDAILVGIRWDEHGMRAKEYEFSDRDWSPKHIRIHPILHWSLDDVWKYTKQENIPYNPMYDYDLDGLVYKSIGCYPCTKPINPSETERSGRAQDKESEEVMERLRALGYM
jgi:sulfate adenylyltransferase subunit 2